jgi:hypothetical protein
MCSKAAYLTRKEASAAARWHRRHSAQQRPYHCRWCGLWHLTTCQARGKRAQWRQDRQREEQPQ